MRGAVSMALAYNQVRFGHTVLFGAKGLMKLNQLGKETSY